MKTTHKLCLHRFDAGLCDCPGIYHNTIAESYSTSGHAVTTLLNAPQGDAANKTFVVLRVLRGENCAAVTA